MVDRTVGQRDKRELLGALKMFCIFTVMAVTQVYTLVKTHPTVNLNGGIYYASTVLFFLFFF